MNLFIILVCFAAGFLFCDDTLSPLKDTAFMQACKKSHAAIIWIAGIALGYWLRSSQWGLMIAFFSAGGFMHVITDFLPMFSRRCLRCRKPIKKGDFCADCVEYFGDTIDDVRNALKGKFSDRPIDVTIKKDVKREDRKYGD